MITVPQSNNDISFDSLPSMSMDGVANHQPISDVTEDIFLPTEAITMSNSPSTSKLTEQWSNNSFYFDSFPFIGNVARHDPISVGTDDNLMSTEAFLKDIQISPKQQEYKQPARTSSENLVSPNGVDAFGTKKSAPDRFRYSYGNNGSVDFYSVAPIIDKGEKVDEPLQLEFTKMFSEDFLLKEETPSKEKSYDTHTLPLNCFDLNCFDFNPSKETLPPTEYEFFDFKSEELMIAKIPSKQALIGSFESFLEVLADKVEEGYALIVAFAND